MLRLLCLFLGWALWATGQLVAQESPARLAERAKRLYDQHRYAEAIEPFAQAAKQDSSENILLPLADCYRQTGLYGQAAQTYTRLLRQKPEQTEALYALGQVQRILGQTAEAQRSFEAYQRIKPEDTKVKLQLAGLEFQRQNVNQPAAQVLPLQNLNSPQSDYAPARYKEGILFVSTRTGSSGKRTSGRTGQAFGDLYLSKTADLTTFDNPEPFAISVNSLDEEGPAALDSSQTVLYLTRSVEVTPNPDLSNPATYVLKLFEARNVNDYWTNFRELPFNGTSFSTGHPSLSQDGRLLFFASNRPGGLGGTDIWVCVKGENGWSSPQNAGPEVNTPGNELFPYFHFDSTLYFASDLRPGFGGLDVFAAKRSPGKWETARNLGPGVNTSYDDFGLLLARQGDRGVLSSNRPGGMGGDDLYLFYLKPQAPTADTPAVATVKLAPNRPQAELAPVNPPRNELILRGRVMRQVYPVELPQPVSGAKVELSDLLRNTDMAYTDSLGRFSFKLSDTTRRVLNLIASRKGYENTQQRVDLRVTEADSVTLELPAIPQGIRYRKLPAVYFDLNSTVLTAEGRSNLNQILDFLNLYPELLIEVRGHTCILGNPYLNTALSTRRAIVVRDALLAGGLNAQRIQSTRGVANSESEFPNPQDAYELSRNRRVEVIVVGVK